MTNAIPTFANVTEANDWMAEAIADEECVDGYRFAFDDDAEAVSKYEAIHSNGCCGFFDADIVVDGRTARIGCNYGH